MIDIQKRVVELSGSRDAHCLTCYSRTGNWMAELHDLLEDMGISAEDFCNANFPFCGKPFVVKRGRLRLQHGDQCINREYLVSMLMELAKA